MRLLAGGRPRDLPALPVQVPTAPARAPAGDIDELADLFDAPAFAEADDVVGDHQREGSEEQNEEGWETEDSEEEEEMADQLRNEQEGSTQSTWHRAQEKRRQRWPAVRMAALPAIAGELSGFIAQQSSCFRCGDPATQRCRECSRHREHVRTPPISRADQTPIC